jgi:tetratricopeptide (TPR) repeat protein
MRVIAGIPVLLFGVLAAAATGDVAERDLRQAMGYAQRGLSALQKGNAARAREDLTRAVAKIPNLPDARAGLGHLAMREKRFEDALREYRLAETGSKDMISFRVLLETERFSHSRDELQELRTRQMQLVQEANRNEMRAAVSTNSAGDTSSGRIQRELAQVEARMRVLETMSPPNPDTSYEPPADVLFFQGNALFNLKRTDEAVHVWESAAKRMQAFAPLQNNLAVAYWMQGRLDDAWASLRRAEALGFKVNSSFRAELEKATPESTEPAGVVAGARP